MIGASTASALQLMVDAMVAAPSVQALVGNRVRGGWSQSSDVGTIVKPMIAVLVDDGAAMAGAPVAQLVMSVYALSTVGTDEALAVYEAARAILHAEELCNTVNGHRGVAYEVQTPITGWYESQACWYAVGRYNLTVFRS